MNYEDKDLIKDAIVSFCEKNNTDLIEFSAVLLLLHKSLIIKIEEEKEFVLWESYLDDLEMNLKVNLQSIMDLWNEIVDKKKEIKNGKT